jgi:hypothetical protein
MGTRLIQVALPFLLEIVVQDATKGRLVHLDPALFRLERLVEKLVKLHVLHDTPPQVMGGLRTDCQRIG